MSETPTPDARYIKELCGQIAELNDKVADYLGRAERAEAELASLKNCPIGMLPGSPVCSAGTCHACLISHIGGLRTELAEARSELSVFREQAANINNMWRHEFDREIEAATYKFFKRMAWPHTELRALAKEQPR